MKKRDYIYKCDNFNIMIKNIANKQEMKIIGINIKKLFSNYYRKFDILKKRFKKNII